MRVTDTWLRTAIAKNRGSARFAKTVDRGPGRQGLRIVIYGDGTANFGMRYTRPSGARVYMPIGPYGEAGLSLAEACDVHDAALKLLSKGIDPIEDRERRQADLEEARRERAGADTVAAVVEQFIHRRLCAERWDAASSAWVREPKIKARKRPEVAAALLGHVDSPKPARVRKGKRPPVATLISQLGSRKARELTRRELIAFLDDIVDRGAPVTANRVHALLKQMFDWAAAKDLIPASPMAGVERPGGDESPRDRALSAEEVKLFWSKLPETDMAEPTSLALQLLLVTAQRRGELTHAKWAHFDLEGKTWTIPVELLKSSHSRRSKPEPHTVPLSSLAVDILGRLKALTGKGIYVLPARVDQTKDQPYSDRVLSRAVRENESDFGIPRFTPHDLRRTAASFMTKIGVPRLHVEKVLNHSTGDIAEIYDRHDYSAEKKTALERWGEHLKKIIDGVDANVIQMPWRA
jgi:integrase